MPEPMNRAASPRIASLVPSLTELVVALGLGGHLIARTGFCIHPRTALSQVPKIGGTKDVNLAKLERLRPTHVLVNVDENRLETVNALRGWGEQAQGLAVHGRIMHKPGTGPQAGRRAAKRPLS